MVQLNASDKGEKTTRTRNSGNSKIFLHSRCVSGFNKEIDESELKSQLADVKNVVLPADSIHGNWVDIVVEEESNVHHQGHDSHTTCADLEW